MSDLTLQQILAKIGEAVEASDDKKLQAIAAEYGTVLGVQPILDGLVREYEAEAIADFLPSLLEVVSYDGGGEGSAEDAPEIVYQYKPTGQFFGKGGWYQSYNGTDWDEDWNLYEPVPTTVYRPKKD